MAMPKNGEVSFWYADIGGLPVPRPALPGDVEADICIVGAGYTGLWTAYYLKQADPSLNIVIAEKDFAGFGASGRNGGWCTGEFWWNRRRYLTSGTREGVMALERVMRGTVDEIIRVAEAEGIDADIHRTQLLSVACTPAQLERLRHEQAENAEWQVPEARNQLIGAAEVAQRIRVHNAKGALLTDHVARIQPAKLVRGLADAVERLDVTIYEQTPVTQIAPGMVTTTRGRIRASRIVRATEGFTHHIPGNERIWLPLNSAIVVTEPLSDALWDEIGWEGREVFGDASHAYCYAQRTREGRIAMGGRGVPYRFASGLDQNGQTQPATIRQLEDILYRLLPQVKGVRLDHAWCGVLGVPRDWCTTVGFNPATGIGWCGGYVGLGVSTSNLGGRTLADLLLDRETELTGLPWVNRQPRKWEVEPLRWLGVHSMYWLYHLADRREAIAGGRATSRLARLADFITGH